MLQADCSSLTSVASADVLWLTRPDSILRRQHCCFTQRQRALSIFWFDQAKFTLAHFDATRLPALYMCSMPLCAS